jgi:uncharacterized protein YdhG (YjbR/CyaY superfamily)
MDKSRSSLKTIDEYILLFPADIQKKLQQLRRAIHAAAPDAVEKISYQMPTFYQAGNLVYFAAFKDHFGFFPTSSARANFEKELSIYPGGKGTIQFPLDQPLPLDLITRIVKFRVAENLAKAASKPAKKKY